MKNIPLRKCLVSKEMLPKEELFRVVKTKEGKVLFDETNSLNGRGAYLKKDLSVLKTAKKKDVLKKAFNLEIDESVYDEMIAKLEGGKYGQK